VPVRLRARRHFVGGGNKHCRHEPLNVVRKGWPGLQTAICMWPKQPNTNGNNLLVYSPSHAQLAAKTISNQILAPAAVAFDPSGNLAIANWG